MMSSKIWRVFLLQGKTFWRFLFLFSLFFFVTIIYYYFYSSIVINKIYSFELTSDLQWLMQTEEAFSEGEFWAHDIDDNNITLFH